MSTTIEKLPLRLIEPDPNNPRQNFDQQKLQELADSIKSIGLEQPISVRPQGDRFMVIQGHRRFHAHQLLEAETIDAIVRNDIDERDAALRQIIENLQRADLSPIEEAKGFRSAMERLRVNQSQLAKNLGVPRTKIAKALALLNTDQAVQQALASGQITAGHGEALVTLPKGQQVEVLSAIREGELTVAETRKFIRADGKEGGCATSNTELPPPPTCSTSNAQPTTHQVILLQKAADSLDRLRGRFTAHDRQVISEVIELLRCYV